MWRQVSEQIDYALAFTAAALCWLLSMGLLCAHVETEGGAEVTIHGAACACGCAH